ncbi:D-serine/D-alanine/glycine transporter [Cutibacterium acnes JCM 18918]|nr:D-serine/D-alanine/glycine transporter [Cutibacterium acnes JCM 18918]
MTVKNQHSAAEEQHLRRSLSNRHIQLIAISGAIGTGLFMGSGKSISTAGPSIVVAYLVIGAMLFFVMRAMGELLLHNLQWKSFQDFAADLLGPWAGFFLGWTYWLCWVVTGMADVIAITSYWSFWTHDRAWAFILTATTLLLLLALNLLTVKLFGELEFWFALSRSSRSSPSLRWQLCSSSWDLPQPADIRRRCRICGPTVASLHVAGADSSAASRSQSLPTSVLSWSAPPLLRPPIPQRRCLRPSTLCRSVFSCSMWQLYSHDVRYPMESHPDRFLPLRANVRAHWIYRSRWHHELRRPHLSGLERQLRRLLNVSHALRPSHKGMAPRAFGKLSRHGVPGWGLFCTIILIGSASSSPRKTRSWEHSHSLRRCRRCCSSSYGA